MPLSEQLQERRREIQELEMQLHRKRDELFELQKQIFKQCTHEWIQEEKGDGVNGFWYGYCPYTCKHCGHMKTGPIKL